jgi:hypothetical protein
MIIALFRGDVDLPTVRGTFAAMATLGGSMRRRSVLLQLACEAANFFEDNAWALEAIDKAIENGLIDLAWMQRCPLLEGVRAAPGFAEREGIVAERASRIALMYRSR